MFVLTLEQVLKLFLFILIGYLLAKVKILPENTPKVLSVLTLYVFLPALTFRTFSRQLTPERLAASGELMLTAVLAAAAVFVFGTFCGHRFSRDRYAQNVLAYSINIPNFGYMGYPLCLALFGEQALLQMQLFCLPFSLYVYSEGYRLLLDRPLKLRSFLNPPMIALLLGAVCGLLRIPLPALTDGVLADLSDCIGPAAMLLTGAVLAGFRLKDILGDWRIYAATALSMVLIPLLTFGAGSALRLSRETQVVMMCLFAMPIGLNGIVFPSSVGKDCRLGAGLACVSNVAALGTIPLLFSLLQ